MARRRDWDDRMMTPLYGAVLAGDLDAVRDEVAQGGDVNARNDDNRWTALMVAVAEGSRRRGRDCSRARRSTSTPAPSAG